MDRLISQLAPARQMPHEEDASNDAAGWGSMGGYGNLARDGAVSGMAVPAVPDVSASFL